MGAFTSMWKDPQKGEVTPSTGYPKNADDQSKQKKHQRQSLLHPLPLFLEIGIIFHHHQDVQEAPAHLSLNPSRLTKRLEQKVKLKRYTIIQERYVYPVAVQYGMLIFRILAI